METETIWNDDVVADNDILIAAIEEDIANTRSKLARLSNIDEEDDILLM